MSPLFNIIFKNAIIVNHNGMQKHDIGVKNGRISALGDLSLAQTEEEIDCSGLHIIPGIIDSQVHFREPGFEHKENLETGSLAAVLGGVTTVFEMPNTNPLTVSKQTLFDKLQRAHHRMHCDFAFWIGGTSENIYEISRLERLPGVAGIKVFIGSSTGNLLVKDDNEIRKILKKAQRRVAFHAEDEDLLNLRKSLQIAGDVSSHSVWRNENTALTATKRLVYLARETGAKIHILHVSTAEEMKFLENHKDLITIEVTPHHLTLTTDDYPYLGTLMQVNPPIRNSFHQGVLWRSIVQGIVDVIGSDHAPHTLKEKKKLYPNSPSGATGVQTIVPLMLDYVNAGYLTLERFVDLLAHSPARIFGISCKGRIAVGYDADLTILDLKRRVTITNSIIRSKSAWTPYDGRTVTGWPVGTVVRGKKVMWEGKILTPATGEAVKFI